MANILFRDLIIARNFRDAKYLEETLEKLKSSGEKGTKKTALDFCKRKLETLSSEKSRLQKEIEILKVDENFVELLDIFEVKTRVELDEVFSKNNETAYQRLAEYFQKWQEEL